LSTEKGPQNRVVKVQSQKGNTHLSAKAKPSDEEYTAKDSNQRRIKTFFHDWRREEGERCGDRMEPVKKTRGGKGRADGIARTSTKCRVEKTGRKAMTRGKE